MFFAFTFYLAYLTYLTIKLFGYFLEIYVELKFHLARKNLEKNSNKNYALRYLPDLDWTDIGLSRTAGPRGSCPAG